MSFHSLCNWEKRSNYQLSSLESGELRVVWGKINVSKWLLPQRIKALGVLLKEATQTQLREDVATVLADSIAVSEFTDW